MLGHVSETLKVNIKHFYIDKHKAIHTVLESKPLFQSICQKRSIQRHSYDTSDIFTIHRKFILITSMVKVKIKSNIRNIGRWWCIRVFADGKVWHISAVERIYFTSVSILMTRGLRRKYHMEGDRDETFDGVSYLKVIHYLL